MPVCFTDDMVLQRNTPVAVWGDAASRSEITITFAGQTVKTKAERNGKWRCTLEPMPANAKPQVLRISSTLDGKTLELKNVLVGEVWLAGGQSNMAFPLRSHKDWKEQLPSKPNPAIRILQIPVTEFGKINRKHLKWRIYNKTSTPAFSAVAYFFATELQKRLKIPVGIIGSYRGGTWNENWMTPASIKNEPKLKYLFEKYDKE
jgi:sialate O-acetylesterase